MLFLLVNIRKNSEKRKINEFNTSSKVIPFSFIFFSTVVNLSKRGYNYDLVFWITKITLFSVLKY